jgi:multidrug efflux pump subunit AcrA (membrane-fusion protein)
VSNVVTYYALVAVTGDGVQSVKPGMTANVTVVTASVDNAITLPSSAVTVRGNSSAATVNVEIGNDPTKTQATQIRLGLKGDNSYQITSGLKAGDRVVVARQTATATSTTGTRTGGGLGGGGFGGGGGAVRPGG